MRLYPWTVLRSNDFLTTEAWAEVCSDPIAMVNGGITEDNVRAGYVTNAKLDANAATSFDQVIATGSDTMALADLSTGWNLLDSMTLTKVCQDGMLIGAFCGTIRKFGGLDSDTKGPRYNWWEVAVFVDGVEIAGTDRIHEEQTQVVVDFMTPVGSGSRVIEVKVRGLMPVETIGGSSTTDVWLAKQRLLWVENRYR